MLWLFCATVAVSVQNCFHVQDRLKVVFQASGTYKPYLSVVFSVTFSPKWYLHPSSDSSRVFPLMFHTFQAAWLHICHHKVDHTLGKRLFDLLLMRERAPRKKIDCTKIAETLSSSGGIEHALFVKCDFSEANEKFQISPLKSCCFYWQFSPSHSFQPVM